MGQIHLLFFFFLRTNMNILRFRKLVGGSLSYMKNAILVEGTSPKYYLSLFNGMYRWPCANTNK
uniref:Uncharacterized protein n=1 Tax=Cycas taitungensis TaxID=54799 RepID=A6H5G4_CYCTA|nr:hypothetical protein CYtaCp022 [Cycas taitungensis]BAF64930.1 hypothetical protein [Cycas taitungensis]